MLRRRWLVLVVGVLLSAVVAIFVAYKPASGGFVSRATPTYQSDAHLLLSPGLRSLIISKLPPNPTASPLPSGDRSTVGDQYRDQDFGAIADVYTQLATSDPVLRQVEAQFGNLADRNATLAAYRVVTKLPGQAAFSSKDRFLPVLDVQATAANPAASQRLAQLAANDFTGYIDQLQTQEKVPDNQRIVLTTIQAAQPGELTSSSPKTLLALIFVAGLVLTVIAAGIREASVRGRAEARTARSTEPYPAPAPDMAPSGVDIVAAPGLSRSTSGSVGERLTDSTTGRPRDIPVPHPQPRPDYPAVGPQVAPDHQPAERAGPMPPATSDQPRPAYLGVADNARSAAPQSRQPVADRPVSAPAGLATAPGGSPAEPSAAEAQRLALHHAGPVGGPPSVADPVPPRLQPNTGA